MHRAVIPAAEQHVVVLESLQVPRSGAAGLKLQVEQVAVGQSKDMVRHPVPHRHVRQFGREGPDDAGQG